MHIDLNCDMGEGMATDELLMPFITSANIACGYHAGSEKIMRSTIDLAMKHQVRVGAHPSFKDKTNFGRLELILPPEDIYTLIIQQLVRIGIIAEEKGTRLCHVKPHGALYNISARHTQTARAIATAIKDFNDGLILYGASGSCSIREAQSLGLSTFSEVFADRTYQDDGSLTPRGTENAQITSPGVAVRQVMQMVEEGMVTTLSGKKIPVLAETICIHGDGKNAPFIAREVHAALKLRLAET